MFAVLFPTSYAWQLHGFWMGLLTFVVMSILVVALNMTYLHRPSRASDEGLERELDPRRPMRKLVLCRTILAAIACIIIAITGAQGCRIDENGQSHCPSIFGM